VRVMRLRILIPLSSLLTVIFWARCTARPERPAALTVAVSSSLFGAFEEIGAAFEAETGLSVALASGATGNLAQQMRNGAPYDVFAAAGEEDIQSLIEEGVLDGESSRLFGVGVLLVVWDPEQLADVRGIQDLASPAVSRIALANPAHAPYGKAAEQALRSSGLWESLQPRLIFAETVRQAYQIVESGNAPLGLVARSTIGEGVLRTREVDPRLYDPVPHFAATRIGSPLHADAVQFVEFLLSTDAQSILQDFGMRPPPGS